VLQGAELSDSAVVRKSELVASGYGVESDVIISALVKSIAVVAACDVISFESVGFVSNTELQHTTTLYELDSPQNSMKSHSVEFVACERHVYKHVASIHQVILIDG
jgi:hypothetical protein